MNLLIVLSIVYKLVLYNNCELIDSVIYDKLFVFF